jgi:hypothetical protein
LMVNYCTTISPSSSSGLMTYTKHWHPLSSRKLREKYRRHTD